MSPADWQLATFALLGLVAAAGIGWYERTARSSRLVAIVATLVGIAVAGRVLFAALPSVKPTTDIILIGGMALGGAPGFAIGALTGLVSNFYFGQGPWTPWQMVGWGMAGLAGAALVRVVPRPSRWLLAAVCGVAGLVFGIFMNIGTALNFTGGNFEGGFIAIQLQAAPFDVAHALANVGFALLFGPALIAILARLKRRSMLAWPATIIKYEPPGEPS